MVAEAPQEQTGHGRNASGPGWFIVNAAECGWYSHPKFGDFAKFEGATRFEQIGVNIHVLHPGQPSCYYHRESAQENFLVLQGCCTLIIAGQERALKTWDFVHCPPDTEHVFVGAGEAPCALLMIGARAPDLKIHYPVHATAAAHGASAASATDDPREAYADLGRSEPMASPWAGLVGGDS